ncbi:MAG TPA: FtsK/SpoIIIE domain-containing protein, partial [Pirellulaceae bacterium]
MNAYCRARFAEWGAVDWNTWRSPSEELVALPLGGYQVDLSAIPEGISADPRLASPWSSLRFPALLAFPAAPSLLIESELEGRRDAVRLLQNGMFRLLTSLPAGKVRFTIFDPTGLGENFSTFMHLADFDERLVTNRIWTEASHIHQRLTDLTEHMENVIQKYLRNEFASIQEYNAKAGEIAEPFQILVVANFPANFTEESARRLVSIASSGARCGVYFLISVDTRLKLPNNFDLADLEAAANTLVVQEGRWSWKADDLREFPLDVEAPPSADLAGTIMRVVGKQAKDANRVEVPFDSVTPPESSWWQSDSRHHVEVPLGRAGATQLQYLSLGSGTSQHVLVAGKTGSGKSTLLNALITNLALHYSPEELQFFLVDFKKGVEFKAYAEHRLPHARVIAIESEREFGLSVLERLDAELHERGELFRACGSQSLAAFREARPEHLLPRLLLIVDEFQEFFVKDDKIAQEASLLLDRLVRQGRAFGVHVLLGSQTLAGAYTLARSTLGQMAVRIALQCSESDAHLILSEENTAARLLNRPGEAIYNNANGLFEGNHPFQIVWLPDALRESYLRRVSEFARRQGRPASRPLVFEGNVPARLAENAAFLSAWREPPASTSAMGVRGWLGAAVAIKDPTQIVFRRQSGAHLLIVGQQEEMALGLMTSLVLGL